MSITTKQSKQEIWSISRYIGAVCARYITVVLLMPALIFLNGSVLYVILPLLALPLIIRAFAPDTTPDGSRNSMFIHTQQKYHYSFRKYQAEKNANPLILLLLILWQYRMINADLPVFWRVYPGMLLLIYILSRIGISILFRIYLHHRFLHLDTLED